MRYTKTIFILFSLFALLLFPAMPHAALEYSVISLNLVSASEVENLSQNISMFSIYTAAILMGLCALGVVVFVLWMLSHMRVQARHGNYRAW